MALRKFMIESEHFQLFEEYVPHSFQLDSNQQITQFGIYQSVRNSNIRTIVTLNATNTVLQIFYRQVKRILTDIIFKNN